MLDKIWGFFDDVGIVAKQTKSERQVLFFGATWNDEVQSAAQALCCSGSKPVRISYGQERSEEICSMLGKRKARDGIVQEVVVVDHDVDDEWDRWEKQEAEKYVLMEKHLTKVLRESDAHKVLVFVSQRRIADNLRKQLREQGFEADAMHGGKSQSYRLWALDQFRRGDVRLLICTDVLSRGIDIPDVSHILIHEMGEVEEYIHRIGRTARGQYGTGHALVFFEYWYSSPQLAAELIQVLEESRQHVPSQLRKIADEVVSGKRKARSEWHSPDQACSSGSTDFWQGCVL